MPTPILAYLATAVIFFGMDFAWLSFAGSRIYKAHLGTLMLEKPLLPVAAGFYLMYVVAVVALVVIPALDLGSWKHALWAGALFGLAAYGTYDLTNQATLAGWSGFVSVVDMAWGTFATGMAATGGYFITQHFISRPLS